MPIQKLLVTLCLIGLFPLTLHAGNQGFTEITAPETKLMMEQNEDVILINVLSALEYELQHIPDSISIPVNTLRSSPRLPKDKSIPLIFYCMGPR
jgi:rhodanese-related sulfurtransferase